MSYIKSLKFFCFFSCWITLFAVLSATNAQTLTDSLRKEIHFGIDETINNQFSEAETRFRRLIATYPEHPAGYFYTGSTIQAEILDREDYARQQEFDEPWFLTAGGPLGQIAVNRRQRLWIDESATG